MTVMVAGAVRFPIAFMTMDSWGRWGAAMNAEYVCQVVLPGVPADLGFQEEIASLVPGHWGKYFQSVRAGQLDLCIQVAGRDLNKKTPKKFIGNKQYLSLRTDLNQSTKSIR